jgi:hypothetical protein
MALFDQLISIYDQFISIFPPGIQWIISLILFLTLVFWFLDLVKRNLLWLILLVILLPASIPILRSIFNGLVAFLQYLI